MQTLHRRSMVNSSGLKVNAEWPQTNLDLSEVIAENFGANATYVEGLLEPFSQ